MANETSGWEQLKTTMVNAANEIVTLLPTILGGLLILIAGWLVARVVRLVTIKLLNLLNGLLERLLAGRVRAIVRFSNNVTTLVGGTLFWITLFVFSTAALRFVGLEGIATWLERIIEYLPAILTGGLIILAGYILSALVRDLTQAAARTAELAEADMISRLAQTITLITALVIGMDQMGIDITFLTIMLGVSTAALLAGFALAFGVGSRNLVSNLIAAHYMKEWLEPGQNIRIGNWQGTVLDLSPTAVILDTPEGRTSIPAKLFQEQACQVLLEDNHNG